MSTSTASSKEGDETQPVRARKETVRWLRLVSKTMSVTFITSRFYTPSYQSHMIHRCGVCVGGTGGSFAAWISSSVDLVAPQCWWGDKCGKCWCVWEFCLASTRHKTCYWLSQDVFALEPSQFQAHFWGETHQSLIIGAVFIHWWFLCLLYFSSAGYTNPLQNETWYVSL